MVVSRPQGRRGRRNNQGGSRERPATWGRADRDDLEGEGSVNTLGVRRAKRLVHPWLFELLQVRLLPPLMAGRNPELGRGLVTRRKLLDLGSVTKRFETVGRSNPGKDSRMVVLIRR